MPHTAASPSRFTNLNADRLTWDFSGGLVLSRRTSDGTCASAADRGRLRLIDPEQRAVRKHRGNGSSSEQTAGSCSTGDDSGPGPPRVDQTYNEQDNEQDQSDPDNT